MNIAADDNYKSRDLNISAIKLKTTWQDVTIQTLDTN